MSDTALRQAGAAPLKPGDPQRIGPYVPLGELGSGGMGRVFLARPADGRTGLAAVKVIRPEYAGDVEFRRRFGREAAVQESVRTPHAPRLQGTGFHDELLWMATDYVPGLSLADAVRDHGVLPGDAVWRLVADLGQALLALGSAGVVHRDLKPSNVILSVQGAHVIDFGISKASGASMLTATGQRVGTPAFMAPEYLRTGHTDAASDVFSLGGTLVYAATGQGPFGLGTGMDVMHRVVYEEPDGAALGEVHAVDPALGALLSACLAKEPTARPTAQQLVATAAGAAPPAEWQEPLRSQVATRRAAYEQLLRVPMPPLPTERVNPTAPPPGFGPPVGAGGGPANPPGATGTPDAVGAAGTPGIPGAPVAPGAPGIHTPGGSGFTSAPWVPGSPATPAPPDGGAPVVPAIPFTQGPPPVPCAPAPPSGSGRRRGRGPFLLVAAVLAVCAVVVTALVLTREGAGAGDSADRAASSASAPAGPDAPEARGPGPDDLAASPLPEESAEASATPEEPEPGRSTVSPERPEPAAPSADARPAPVATVTATAPPGTVTKTPAANPATSPSKPPWISRCDYYSGAELTAYGDKGVRVTQVQCMLTKRGYSVGPAGVDSQFGADTKKAVIAFQRTKGLTDDGMVGPNTWAALREWT